MFLLVLRFKSYLNWAISKGMFTRIDTLVTTGTIKLIIIEMLVLTIGPYEFLENHYFMEYEDMYRLKEPNYANELLTVLSFGKFFFFLRALTYFSRFTNPRSQRVCAMSGCKANTLFAIKSVVK